MKNIVIASGKGGTGKTTVAVNLAYYLSIYEQKKLKLLDCDVEAPNDYLFINAKFNKSENVNVPKPVWKKENCTFCGKCIDICNYNAITKVKDKVLIFNELCHSCGACAYLCPSKALEMNLTSIGKIEIAENHVPFIFGYGILNIGESLAPIIIKKLKDEMAEDYINILDAAPGTTCPVVKTMENMDYCLLVTEPTPFGLNDLILAVSLSAKLHIPTGIVINRSYGDDKIIENFARDHKIPILGKISFNKKYAKSYSNGEILINSHPELKTIFSSIYDRIQNKPSIPVIKEEKELVTNKTNNIFSQNSNSKSEEFNYTEILVISGKGGTGKTSITAALAELMENKVLADNDVDAANLHLICKPDIIQSDEFIGGKTYVIDQKKCTACGDCKRICHFDAIELSSLNDYKYKINEISCEGCGFCSHICTSKAISSKDSISGKWYISKTKGAYFSHARLSVGEENSGKLVSLVRDNAVKLSNYYNVKEIISDGPPGIGCPVISAITGVDLALIVAEPTISGIHDMKRILELAQHFQIKSFIIINKYDLNEDVTNQIVSMTKDYSSEVLAKIPFDRAINDSIINGHSIITYGKGKAYRAILNLWENLKDILEKIK